jgi:DNA-binding response OmpR family regulator
MTHPKRILVVEDDAAIRLGIVDALHATGHETLEAGDGRRGLDLALHAEFDLLLLDVVLPHHDGIAILREVRRGRPTLPVILLTARGAEAERVEGLRTGADDYIVKPFSVKELLARIAAVLRRSPERPSDRTGFTLAAGTADLVQRELRFADGSREELSERECELLRYLACNAGRPVSRDEILSRVWRIEPGRVETRTIDMHIARLREKLRDDAAEPRVLRTVRGKGYMLVLNDGDRGALDRAAP